MKAVVEIPAGSRYKYEIKDGQLAVDRLIPDGIRTPVNYGYLVGTMAADGDPLDVFIISPEPIHPGTQVNVEILSGIHCTDQDVNDEKILAKIEGYEVGDTEMKHKIMEIINYLDTYKKGFLVGRPMAEDEVLKLILSSIEAAIPKV